MKQHVRKREKDCCRRAWLTQITLAAPYAAVTGTNLDRITPTIKETIRTILQLRVGCQQ